MPRMGVCPPPPSHSCSLLRLTGSERRASSLACYGSLTSEPLRITSFPDLDPGIRLAWVGAERPASPSTTSLLTGPRLPADVMTSLDLRWAFVEEEGEVQSVEGWVPSPWGVGANRTHRGSGVLRLSLANASGQRMRIIALTAS